MKFTVLVLLISSMLATAFAQSATTDPKLEAAVAAMRKVDPSRLDDKQREAKGKEIDEAWQYIGSLGAAGSQRLKDEIRKLDAAGEKDDFFKLGASAVLWGIGKVSEAETIARIWNSVPVSAQYRYVFYTAFSAAVTRDVRVAPMLRALLKDDKGEVFIAQHSLNLTWPLTLEIIWGVYGTTGLPVLNEVLHSSSDPAEKRTAIMLLSKCHYLPALTKIRAEVSNTNPDVRRAAIMSLGRYGDPRDFTVIETALKATDPQDLWPAVYAAYEFEDLRLVPKIIPLISSKDENIRLEASSTVSHLLTPEGFALIKKMTRDALTADERDFWERRFLETSQAMNSTWEQYSAASATEKAALIAKARKAEWEIPATSTEKLFTHDDLIAGMKVWKEKSRITDSPYQLNNARQVIKVATVEDLEALIDVRASVYRRLSDECLYEIRVLDDVIRQVSRSRYRKGIGISEKVEPK